MNALRGLMPRACSDTMSSQPACATAAGVYVHSGSPVQQGSQLLGYVGSELGGSLKLIAILFMLIYFMPAIDKEEVHFLLAQKPPHKGKHYACLFHSNRETSI